MVVQINKLIVGEESWKSFLVGVNSYEKLSMLIKHSELH